MYSAKYNKVNNRNSLVVNYPEIARTWDFKKNGSKKPNHYSYASHQKVWWKCEKNHPSWEATIKNRTTPRGCYYCSGNKVSRDNSLSINHPDIAKEWDYKKNGSAKPGDFSYGSGKKFWWLCKKGHSSYQATILSRTGQTLVQP